MKLSLSVIARSGKPSIAVRCGGLRYGANGTASHPVHQGSSVKQPCVYIMASKRNGTLYTGVTSDLARRAYQHRIGAVEGFTRRYGCKRLVWYERYERIDEAIAREKQIKGGSRSSKIALIVAMNPEWRDLYELLNA